MFPFVTYPNPLNGFQLHASKLIAFIPSNVRRLSIHYRNVESSSLLCPIPPYVHILKLRGCPNIITSLGKDVMKLDMGLMDAVGTVPSMNIDDFIQYLPSSVTILVLPAICNAPLLHLPNLTSLVLGERFNESLDSLPSSMRRLTFYAQLALQSNYQQTS